MDNEPKEMGLSDFEYAFYTAVAKNKSAEELMGKDKLRELAVVLFEKVKANPSHPLIGQSRLAGYLANYIWLASGWLAFYILTKTTFPF